MEWRSSSTALKQGKKTRLHKTGPHATRCTGEALVCLFAPRPKEYRVVWVYWSVFVWLNTEKIVIKYSFIHPMLQSALCCWTNTWPETVYGKKGFIPSLQVLGEHHQWWKKLPHFHRTSRETSPDSQRNPTAARMNSSAPNVPYTPWAGLHSAPCGVPTVPGICLLGAQLNKHLSL